METTSPYIFTNRWFLSIVSYWPNIFRAAGWSLDVSKPYKVLEIGSFEGQSTCWMLNNLLTHPESEIFCVDPFTGSIEHNTNQTTGLFDRFCHNIKSTGNSDKVKVCQGTSEQILPKLLASGILFDFCYIDGSHCAADVLFDAVLAWKMLRPGGLIIFDDYLWPVYQDQPLLNPKFAIDAFVNCHLDQIKYLQVPITSQQAFVKKP